MSLKKRIAVITALLGAATVTIHVVNRIITLVTTLDNILNIKKGSFYEWRFGKIFYTCKGSGSPILLIHDLESYSSSHEWNKIVNKLAETNKVYCIDLLGCGRSDKPNITYTNFLYVQLIADFINDIINEKADVIASNNASSIPIMTAAFDKSVINRIGIINPVSLNSTAKNPTKRTKFAKHLINSPIIGTLIYNILNNKFRIERKFYEDFYSDSTLISTDDIKAYVESAHLGGMNSKHLFASVTGNYLNMNLKHSLSNMDTSIFIIASDSSPNYLTYAETYSRYMPSIEIFISNNTSRYPQLELPDSLVEQIKLIFINE